MTKEEVVLTEEGLAQLEAELDELKNVKRREMAERIKLAISYGDLRENSEYHAAKEDQAMMESRILTIEKLLKKAKVVQIENRDLSHVQIGCTVVLDDQEFNEKVEYKIVGSEEADVAANKISYESPLGKELLGKRVGDTIEVNAPAGVIKYELLDIKVG
ncbi:transcription elongation factor GreA [Xylanibacillus composti]|uniref:Transcription elongation factor GreA n=1 Tax=Xylanibacillus composti TaxID=1572762 RepID=A0A8J4H4V6_9BACL|nr:transcription elongation factor GreA [Xylanibacillus composti]MDT9726114.1 transcription elongation factor GreA [Xylanibacillus composti]GIQ68738.1 transcription elongation factor GreA [Xylanibacillus composti]